MTRDSEEAAQRVAQVLIGLRTRVPTFHEPSRKAAVDQT